ELQRRSGGNPLFLRELTRMLVDENRLSTPPTDYSMPAELRRVLALRIGAISPASQRALGFASAAGEEFDQATIRAAAGEDPDPGRADALAAGLVVEAPGTRRLRFSHVLVQQARYDAGRADERIHWHERLGAVATEPADRARHLL